MTVHPFAEDSQSGKRRSVTFWHGNISDIPDGWLIADGKNGTPDLTDNFLKSPSSYSDGVGARGGNETYGLSESQLPSHTHTITVSGSGGHAHYTGGSGRNFYDSSKSEELVNAPSGGGPNTTENGSHNHSIDYSNNAGSGNSIDNNPSYHEVVTLIKI